MKYKAVIFDLDDTLCNTSDVIEQAFGEVLTEYLPHFPGKSIEELIKLEWELFEKNYKDPAIPVTSVFTLTLHDMFEEYNLKPPIVAINKLHDETARLFASRLKLTKGAYELLEYLKAEMIKVGILTNGPFKEQAQKIDSLNIEQFIDYMVTPDMCISDKPDKKAFYYILDKLRVKPEKALMVGDNFLADVVGAKQIGMNAAYIDMGQNDRTDQADPDYIVKDLHQLKSHLF